MAVVRPGPRDHLITERLAAALDSVPSELIQKLALDGAEGVRRLSLHVSAELGPLLRELGDDREAARQQTELVNELLGRVTGQADLVRLPPEVLTAVKSPSGPLGETPVTILPVTPFSMSDLLVNAEGQPNIGSELKAELASADRVDLICAFVIWSGVSRLRDAIHGVIERGGAVRVITTTYMGATDPRAVDELVRIGAQVRVAFDARTTKLHAKAWLLERESGLTTAFVGSSNLSHTALFDGLEWNIRLSSVDASHVVDRVRTTFDAHWASEHFEDYDPETRGDDLIRALGGQQNRDAGSISFAGLDVHPYPHQQRMLDRLRVERQRHNRHRNLIVAATGTGKTVVSALDYRQLTIEHGRDLSLLFVAHREQILEQSRATFRAVMRDGSFGALLGGGQTPTGNHVFGMVQSLDANRLASLDPDQFDVVVIDEFHHAAAPTYRRLLEHLRPVELLGLTATPERMDGQDVTQYFDGRSATELRLWEAIDQGFLVPFQYFGVADGTDLSALRWSRGGYVLDELSDLLTADNLRVAKLLQALERLVANPQQMRALGFCVSVEHARYMAERFNNAGLPSAAILGATPQAERSRLLQSLARGELRAIFSVDVLGEGVDVPAVDTVLLLRPTDSATVFTQQLGRGLRHAEGKASVTVIDLIGQQHRSFRFDRKLAALLDPRRGPVSRQVADGFRFLPGGCFVDLDRQSEQTVLENLQAAERLGQWRTLLQDLRATGKATLRGFLETTARVPGDLYRRPGQSWTKLRREAGLPTANAPDPGEEERLLRAAARLLHIDDDERGPFYQEMLSLEHPPAVASLSVRQQRMLLMLHYGLWGVRESFADLEAGLAALWPHAAVRDELCQLFGILDEGSERLTVPSSLPTEIPLLLHAAYTRDEVLASFDLGSPRKPPQLREGVKYVPDADADLFFVTLHKSEREYSPTTMYRDYAISPTRFHWESQATQSASSPSIERYREHQARGGHVLLFVRDRKLSGAGVTAPYVFLGRVRYRSHSGSRPVAFEWDLERPMPEELFAMARTVAS